MSKTFCLYLLFFLAVIGLKPYPSEAQNPKRILLKVQSAFPTNLPGLGTTITWLQEKLKTASNNKFILKVYEPNKLVAPFEILEAVSSGKIQAGYSAAGYWVGKLSSSPIFSSIPFGPEAGEYLAWLFYGNGLKLYQEMYDQAGYNVKVLVCGMISPETSGWFKTKINSPEELKGLKMRFYGLGGKVMQKLGVSTSLLPAGEIFPALEKGVIDATEFSSPAIDDRIGLYKIAKYNYFPGWHQQASIFELLINKKEWGKLDESQKVLLETLSMAATLDSFALSESVQFKAMKKFQKKGVKFVYWSKEMLGKFEKAWEKVLIEESEKSPFFKKVWNDLKDFRSGYNLWEEYAFLPRKIPIK